VAQQVVVVDTDKTLATMRLLAQVVVLRCLVKVLTVPQVEMALLLIHMDAVVLVAAMVELDILALVVPMAAVAVQLALEAMAKTVPLAQLELFGVQQH